jgi:hypothetical protein
MYLFQIIISILEFDNVLDLFIYELNIKLLELLNDYGGIDSHLIQNDTAIIYL